jgi:CheY-like chemotaxis protein
MEAVGQLTGGVAHDFNNLLTSIIGSIDLVERGDAITAEEPRRLLGIAKRSAERGASLTQRLLAFSRRQTLDPRQIDVNRLVAGMSELLHRTLGEGIGIETVLAGGIWRAFVDPNQLENALLNLAINARDAMPNGGKLTIETGNTYLDDDYAAMHAEVTAGQYVLIAVSDTGQGMPEAVMSRAFEPFYTTKSEGKGTGLGLSQVHGFVKQTGGHVKIYSEPGRGTTVKVYLPRHIMEVQVEEPPSRPDFSVVGEGQMILSVEDDEDVREYTRVALTSLGYRVLEAADGISALRILEEHLEIVLLFTDVGLPGMNGRRLGAGGAQSPAGPEGALHHGLCPQCHRPSWFARCGCRAVTEALHGGDPRPQDMPGIVPLVDISAIVARLGRAKGGVRQYRGEHRYSRIGGNDPINPRV